MEKDQWSQLMDEVIVRENLEGNTAQDPKKKVRIMVCADFEDSSIPEEKFYHWSPVHMDDLPAFKLCHPKYWKVTPKESQFGKQNTKKPPLSLMQIEKQLSGL
jgi:hypothetical protein